METTVIIAVVGIVAFLFGIATTIIAKSGEKKPNESTIGSLVVDMSEPYDPALYLSIESDAVIYEVVKKNRKTVTLKVDIYGE